MCAFTAAQQGRRVLVLERANKIGKKILMSGGGKCNFTNHFVEASNFISANPHFCKSALNRYTQWDFIAMVERYGIDYEERKHSQLFCTKSAKEILAMLLSECDLAGVEIKTHSELESVEAIELKGHSEKHQHDDKRSRYLLNIKHDQQSQKLQCQSLVIATGALSIPSLGGSGVGYDIAQQFGLNVTQRRAGLVPFMFSDAFKARCERLSGLALEVEVTCNNQSFTENILFTHRGLSGPVILQISNYWYPGDEISIDLLPGLTMADWLLQAKHKEAKSLLRTVLTKKLAKGLVAELQSLFWPEQADKPLAEFSDKQLMSIGNTLNNWTLKPSATEGYRTAEVTLGGINTDEVSSKTMEATKQQGLYFTGEILDVSGHLGGFNFQWAWSSGYTAGLFV
ncbi:hypothetical protein A9Q78_05550 [Methylophaga sp. 41_12_T18]|nr:hypothetical protein A9Q78_05550 [Methylophaga sp. 41_12_T18]